MEHYDSELEIDEPELETDNNDLYDDEFYNELEAIPKLYSNTTASSARYNATATTLGFGSNGSQAHNASFGIYPGGGGGGGGGGVSGGGGHAYITHSKEHYLKGIRYIYIYILRILSNWKLFCCLPFGFLPKCVLNHWPQ